ncbi:MAG TPA: methylenetetrahydrofolate--tRNA-(uracil(54)-C(5))-methyltransferase (FADH(2)-oxidizing) TrmFO [Anaerolineaceae bacterium]|nr:methylenetetrahydrofolate--tRNA-(uracil(54)-C(5))-methyltransferase (FADH(2)-oxidizing) TrmFO [Anaerolineaceae bacterium]
MEELIIIGGGLAGCEAAWQAAERGIRVVLYEMRPHVQTGAHTNGNLAELVCSNSLGSRLVDRASGLLKEELRSMHSMLLECAEASALPAGGALAVDREAFAAMISARIESHPKIRLVREEAREIPPGPAIIASGPLTSPTLSAAIAQLTGEDHLFFYDAIAPVVAAESIDMSIAFRASRYRQREDEGDGDYVNCPFSDAQYDAFIQALTSAERIEIQPFEKVMETGVKAGAGAYFEGCLPVEVLARRGLQCLAFGPMRPTGLHDPRTGARPRAILQLRQDNLTGSLYNMVGFQTNLRFPEQKRVFRMVPGLENAEFVRYGQMHRNTFIASPKFLRPSLQTQARSDLFFAGQITGVEGYMGNIATGLLAGWNAARVLLGQAPLVFPNTTMLGALCYYITHAEMKDFQPMKANFGILPALNVQKRMTRAERFGLFSQRAIADLRPFLEGIVE